MYDLNCTLFIYKYLNCSYFPELKARIQRNCDYHKYNTRGRNLFRNVDIMRLKICQRSFHNYGINIWNSLIPEVKDSNSLYKLKISMKLYLLSLN